MRGSTHLAGGIVAATVAGVATSAPAAALAVGLVVSSLASLVPDWVNVAIPGIRVKGSLGHRGFTHWGLTALATSLLVWSVAKGWRLPFVGALPWWLYWCVGYVSHLLLDCLTERGAPILWPISAEVSLLPVKENGLFDKFLGATLVVVTVVLLVAHYGLGVA